MMVRKWPIEAKTLRELYLQNNAVMGISWVLASWKYIDSLVGQEDEQGWVDIIKLVSNRIESVELPNLSCQNGFLISFSLVQIWALIGGHAADIANTADTVNAFVDSNVKTGFPFFFDMRAIYCILAISRISDRPVSLEAQAFFRAYILESESLVGGFGSGPNIEPHGGFTFCATASLRLLNEDLASQRTIQWARLRLGQNNGRAGKPADSCYSWWMGASLFNLGFADERLADGFSEKYLVKKTGGYSKFPNMAEPDLFHTFLALATLCLAAGRIDSLTLLPI